MKLLLPNSLNTLIGVLLGLLFAPMATAITNVEYLGEHSAQSLVTQLLSQAQGPAQSCGVMSAVVVAIPHQQQHPLYLLERWQQHPLAEFLNCFSVVRYQQDDLVCQQQGSRSRAACRLTRPVDASERHIIFTAGNQGIASAGTHQIILPATATLSLFAHEVAHWLGLADEYAMSRELATDYCAGRYRHPSLNVVVTATKELTAEQLQALWQQLPWRWAVKHWRQLGQLTSDGKKWRLGSQQGVGLYPIPACANAEGLAWRPVAEYTPMQYHDIGQWPNLYLELIRRQN